MVKVTLYARAPGALATELPTGDVVMMDVDLATYFGLEDVAAEIWRLVEKPMSKVDIVAALLAEFDVAPDICRTETETFINSMLERKLIVADG